MAQVTLYIDAQVNIQGVLGAGTLGYKVMLMIYTACLVKAPGSQSNADNIQGVLGKGTLGHKVMLMIYSVCLVLLYRVCLEKAPWVTK